jgi:hypothetical protein
MVRLLAGLFLLGAAVLGVVTLHERAERIRADKLAVTAEVVGLRGSRSVESVRVEYEFGGQPYHAELLEYGFNPTLGTGDRLTLAIDPDRPSDAAGPGLVSGSRWQYWYQPAGIAGFFLVLIGAWRLIRGRPKDDDGLLVARILVHPHPAWPERADGTVRSLVPGPRTAGPPWEEELAVRRLDAETGEICCVPFLQTRLALGDVVHVDPQGYTGAVTVPSGRVTFAVRCDDPARDVRDELAGTVVEQIGTGLYAVAASAEQAETVHARLRSAERDGRIAYRSILRTDDADTLLL